MLSLAIAAMLAPEPMLAFVARIYYPPSDKRTSHYQIYVSDLHGGHRKQLTFGTNNPYGVVWLGKDALAWADENGKVFVSKLKPFKPIQLKVPDYTEIENNKSHDGMPRGMALIGKNELTPKGLRPFQGTPTWPAIKEGDTTYEYTMPGGRVFLVDVESLKLSFDDKTYKFEEQGSWLYPIRLDDNMLWVKGRNNGGLHGREDEIFKFDTLKGTFTKVIGTIAYIDFTPDSPYYAGTDLAGQDLISYGPKKNVVGAHLFAGNWKTRKRWLVLGGTVHVPSVSVQPE